MQFISIALLALISFTCCATSVSNSGPIAMTTLIARNGGRVPYGRSLFLQGGQLPDSDAEEEEEDMEGEGEMEESDEGNQEEETGTKSTSTKSTRKTVSLSSGGLSFKSLIRSLIKFLRPLFSSPSRTAPAKRATAGKKKSQASSGGVESGGVNLDHLEKSFKSGDSNARLQKELRSFVTNPPEGCTLAVGGNMRSWVVTMVGADGTLYAGEKYRLKMVFPKEYPSKPPSVYFLKPTPRHQHVYSNGDICLNLLGHDWRPTMTAQLLVTSIRSMLSSAKEKKLPQDNAAHAENPPGKQQDSFLYHDERC